MNKKVMVILCLIAVVWVVVISLLVFKEKDIASDFKRTFDVLLPSTVEAEKLYDSYGGFPSEGKRCWKFTMNETDAEHFEKGAEQSGTWYRFPLQEDIALILYGGERNGETYSYCFAEEAGIPNVEAGYWSLVNRNGDGKLFAASSFHFSLEIFDRMNNTIYFYEIDT